MARRVLVLPSSEFEHLFQEGPTELAYAGTPAGRIKKNDQGRIGKVWAKKVLQEQNPKSEILEPEPGTCSDGRRRRASYQAEYDFVLDGRKVQVKSARMTWYSASPGGFWLLRFWGVKFPYGERTGAAFDDLYLVIISPSGMHLIKHVFVTGVGAQGKSTEVDGHQIKVCGSSHTHCWEDALGEMLEKLCERGGCRVVAKKLFSKLDFKDILSKSITPGQAAVAGLPMATMSVEKRGKRIQEIGLAIDRRLHPHSNFSLAEGNRGTANAPSDWVRDCLRVELKSCSLSLDRCNSIWRCRFRRIKPNLFDELWLAIYSPIGIHYYRSNSGSRLGFITDGVRTKLHGPMLLFGGLRGELDAMKAFEVIKAKMTSAGFESVAIMEWEKGRPVPHASSDLVAGLETGGGQLAFARQ